MPQNANNHWFNINVKIVNYTEIKKVLAAENESESKGCRVVATIKYIRYFSSIKVLLVANK